MALYSIAHSVTSGSLQFAFYGAVFTGQGMLQDPSKIQALQDLPTPDSQTKLQSFLSLINYLQPFIPGLSTKTSFLQEQLSQWDWNPSTDAAFQHLKAWICQTLLKVTLAYYDRTKPVMIWTDASSKFRIGTALLKGGQPIAFASKNPYWHRILLCKYWESVSFSMLWSGEIPHLYLWEACSHWEWPQATGNDSAQAYPCGSPKASAEASADAEVSLYHSL